MKYTLRPYQEKAIAELHKWIANNEGNPLLVAPTGSGKSLLISSFISECLEQWPHLKILVLQHRKELIAQNFQKLVATLDPKYSIGIYSAGLGKKQLGKQITFAGVQSIYRNVEKLGQIHLIIADECDLIPPSGEGTWRTVIESLKKVNPKLRVVGFTATPFRLATGSLIDDEGVFNSIAHQIDMMPLIKDGYLSPLISKSSVETPDVADLKIKNGEFAAKETEALFNTRALSVSVLQEINRYASDRKKILIFCSGIDHAEYFAKFLREEGHAADCLTGETSSLFRDQILKDFSSGRIRFLTNCDVLTVGYDEPAIDCIVMLRPTQSARLYCQIIGRASRIAEGKENALILDFAGNIERHGPVDKIRVKKTGSRAIDGKITVRNEVVKEQVKVCPMCRNCYDLSVAVSACGFIFPTLREVEAKHAPTASSKSVTSEDIKPQIEEFDVSFVDYGLHAKEGKPDSLKITYNIGISFKIYDFLCLEHSGFARKVAEQKWKNFSADKRSQVPDTVQEALFCIETGDLKKPAKIRCRKDNKGYWSAVAYKWRPEIEAGNVLAIYDDNDLPF